MCRHLAHLNLTTHLASHDFQDGHPEEQYPAAYLYHMIKCRKGRKWLHLDGQWLYHARCINIHGRNKNISHQPVVPATPAPYRVLPPATLDRRYFSGTVS